MPKIGKSAPLWGLAALALGCGDGNPAPKVYVEPKLATPATVASPADEKQLKADMLKKGMMGAAKPGGGMAMPGGS